MEKMKIQIKKPQSNYRTPPNLQVYNKFMANTDTLHYLNNRFSFNKGVFKINDQTKIVKNFKNMKNKDNIYTTYYWNKKQAVFPRLSSLTPLGINYSIDFTNFFYHQNLFDYKITENDTFYRLEFTQKKNYFLCKIEGYLIVDKYDYGIYEFESKLLNNKPFIIHATNFSNSKSIVFKILKDTYHFKYTKENDKYILDYSNKNTTFIAKNKRELKDITFNETVQAEKTINFGESNLKKFNIFTWDFN